MTPKKLTEILTARQLEICALVRDGLTNREIGELMGSDEGKIKNALRGIYDTLGCDNRVMIALRYEREYPCK
jgi:DNA-binding NarL/FixJ family response regulator